MILTVAVIAGLLAGLIRSWLYGRSIQLPNLRSVFLVFIAFLPQLFAFQLPATRQLVTDEFAAVILVTTQTLLLIFAYQNRSLPGFWALFVGLALNLMVIALNGGLMPISPEMADKVYPNAPPGAWQVGSRLGMGKDVVFTMTDTRLWPLSDRFFFSLGETRVAYSPGDIFIASGAFWSLWMVGEAKEKTAQSPADS